VNLKNNQHQYVISVLNRSAADCPEVLVGYSENLYRAKLVETVLSSLEKRIILVAGPSASGKTTTAKKLVSELLRVGKKAAVISMDDFYKNRSEMPIIDGKINAEVIEALEMGLLEKVLRTFLANGKTSVPHYDFSKGVREDNFAEIDAGKNGVLILEGLHAINPLVCEHLDDESFYRLYVSPHSGYVGDLSVLDRRDLRFLRRLVRDYYTRDSSAERTFEMWEDVGKCEDVYVRPLGKTADRMLDTTHPYEICVLKETAIKVLKTVDKNSLYYEKATALIRFLEEPLSLPLSEIPEKSLLNEFLPAESICE